MLVSDEHDVDTIQLNRIQRGRNQTVRMGREKRIDQNEAVAPSQCDTGLSEPHQPDPAGHLCQAPQLLGQSAHRPSSRSLRLSPVPVLREQVEEHAPARVLFQYRMVQLDTQPRTGR